MSIEADVVREGWGIDVAQVTPLGGEIDASVRIDAGDGSTYCLKRRPNDPTRPVDLEAEALAHVERTDPGLASKIRSTTSGHSNFVVDEQSYWLLEWIDGPLWSDLVRPTAEQQSKLGATARRLQRALEDFEHPGAARTHHWDLRRLDESITKHLDQCRDEREREIANMALALFAERVTPVLDRLPTSVVHQDLNDFNMVITSRADEGNIGVIDFGDVLHSASITELAVATAYAMIRSPHPIDAAAAVASGWFGDDEPSEDELSVLMPLAIGRLVVNALTWAARSADQPEYAHARSSHTWATLHQIAELPMGFVDARLRSACGLELGAAAAPLPQAACLAQSVAVCDLDPHRAAFDGIDVDNGADLWNVGRPELPFALASGAVRADRADFADGSGGPATVQLGIELHLEPTTEVRLPLSGKVQEASPDRLIIAHSTVASDTAGTNPTELETVWSCWHGITSDLAPGHRLDAGDLLGESADTPVHVHVLGFEPARGAVIPRFVRPVDATAWSAVTADPSAFLQLDAISMVPRVEDSDVTALRNSRLASSQRYYYDEPMTLVRASGATFMDANAHLYLDVINNVTHVGHGNHHVVAMASQQMQRLNTNSRFVYEEMGRFADRLVQRLPDPLEVVFLVCTGSEANDLAIRIARQVIDRTNVMVIDGAYHGNTGVVTGISPNRYKGPGGHGPPPTTHEVLQPNRYRGPFGYDDADAGVHYADDVRRVADELVASNAPPAAFIAESLMGTAGQVVFPEGYLASSFAHVRSVGGLCISDEVQVGFGRLGDAFWGFERGGVVPDIVTMGKPMGNGHPIAAVVTTREIADAFDQGMKYFNTFGGNPVSCATANAVLDEIDRLDLQQHARDVGGYFIERLRQLMVTDDRIGDVRGVGLYLGVEFVLDRETKEPARELTWQVCDRLREYGVVMYPNGDLGNSLKIKPPMVFERAHVDRFVDALKTVMDEL